MNDKPTVDIKTLPVITRFIYTIGQLPTSYMMSMTYEEQVVWLCNYLEKEIIPALNTNGEAVEELQNLYELLREYVNSYFDNLDLQEEVNNKLDSMIQDGSLESILTDYFNFNGYIQPIFGGNLILYNKTDFDSLFEDAKNCFDSVIIDFNLVWDSENNKFNYRFDHYTLENAIESINTNGLMLNTNNVRIKALKFHSTKFTTLTDVNQDTLFNAYISAIESTLDNFTFNYESIIILNEDDIVENASYETSINNCINTLRNRYLKTISISKNGIYKIKAILSSIKQNLDFYSFNSYGDYSINGEEATLDDIAKHYDEIKSIAIELKQEKPIIMSEFGCRGSWESFHNAGTDYTDNGLSKPIALVIEGYFKSKLSCILNEAYYWYTKDALDYTPNLLKNIKMKGSIRHG